MFLVTFFFSFFWLGFCSLPSLAVDLSLHPSYCVQYQYRHMQRRHVLLTSPLVVLLPPSRVRDAASSTTGKARTRQLGTGGVVSLRIGRPARSCMPACLTVSARRLLDAMNGRDALPSHQALQVGHAATWSAPPPLRFSSLRSRLLFGGRGSHRGGKKQKGLVTVALRAQQAMSLSSSRMCMTGGFSGRAASCVAGGMMTEREIR
ncbi:hypothetical protein J3F84DRAFT_15550 [Trichoderma pleuroticola]